MRDVTDPEMHKIHLKRLKAVSQYKEIEKLKKELLDFIFKS